MFFFRAIEGLIQSTRWGSVRVIMAGCVVRSVAVLCVVCVVCVACVVCGSVDCVRCVLYLLVALVFQVLCCT